MKGKFLRRISLDEAKERLREITKLNDAETIPVEHALGRILAEPIRSRRAVPHYEASAMDGIAVRSSDLMAASEPSPVQLKIVEAALDDAPSGTCAVVDTGNALPLWADAVVRIENTHQDGNSFLVDAPVAAGKDVRDLGEDFSADVPLFARGHRVDPYDIGALLASGILDVAVASKTRVGVLATGAEIVEPNIEPGRGQIPEFNSRMLSAFVTENGGEPTYLGRVADEAEPMKRALAEAASAHDIVCVIAGSSAGRKDFTVDVLDTLGEVLFHGVDMMPGKPTSGSRIGSTPVLGIPGYPVSAAICYHELLRVMLDTSLGRPSTQPTRISALVRRRLPSKLGVAEYLRVCLADSADGLIVAPLPRGAGSITSLTRADGLLVIPPRSEGFDPDTRVDVDLLRAGEGYTRSIVVAGKPDALSAGIEDVLRRSEPEAPRFRHLGTSPVDALIALRSGEAHLAVDVSGELAAARSKLESENGVQFDLRSLGPVESAGFFALYASPWFAEQPIAKKITKILEAGNFSIHAKC